VRRPPITASAMPSKPTCSGVFPVMLSMPPSCHSRRLPAKLRLPQLTPADRPPPTHSSGRHCITWGPTPVVPLQGAAMEAPRLTAASNKFATIIFLPSLTMESYCIPPLDDMVYRKRAPDCLVAVGVVWWHSAHRALGSGGVAVVTMLGAYETKWLGMGSGFRWTEAETDSSKFAHLHPPNTPYIYNKERRISSPKQESILSNS
jgi:hypothetical protein